MFSSSSQLLSFQNSKIKNAMRIPFKFSRVVGCDLEASASASACTRARVRKQGAKMGVNEKDIDIAGR